MPVAFANYSLADCARELIYEFAYVQNSYRELMDTSTK